LEDETVRAQELQEFLRLRCAFVDFCVALRNLEEALAQLERQAPDVLLADIQLEGESGIDAARALLERLPALKVIFLTGNPGASQDIYAIMRPYAVRFKEYGAQQYIAEDLRKIAAELDSATHRLRFHGLDLPLRDITHLRHIGNETYFYTPAQAHRLLVKMDGVTPLLDRRFLRCGKSFVVNTDHVTGLEENDFLLAEAARIPISRAYKAAVVEGFPSLRDTRDAQESFREPPKKTAHKRRTLFSPCIERCGVIFLPFFQKSLTRRVSSQA